MDLGHLTWIGGDLGNSTVADFEVESSGLLQVIGANIESTPRVANIRTGGIAAFMNCKFQRGGSSTPPFYVESQGKLVIQNSYQSGQAASTALVEKAATGAVVEMVGAQSTNSNLSQDGSQILDTTQKVAVSGPWPQRYATSMPNGSVAGTRGIIVQQVGLSGFYADAPYFLGQDVGGTLRAASMAPALTANTYYANQTFNAALIHVPQTLSGNGAVAAPSIAKVTTTIANTGTANTTCTLASAGVVEGQIKNIVFVTDGGFDAVVTVTNAAWGGAGTVTMADEGDSISLQFLNAKWHVISNNGCTLA
jgi:hypothetical protein